MNNKDKLILSLLVFGIIAFGIIQFGIVPHNNKERQKYMEAQRRPATQDLKTIINYKNKYMGNASNIINLFYHLPLAEVPMDFNIHSDKLTLEVNYKDEVSNIGEQKVRGALIYNSVSAFALIGNLQHIKYNFTENSFSVDRKDIEKFYGSFNNILKEANWKNKVQKKLTDASYIKENFDKLFHASSESAD